MISRQKEVSTGLTAVFFFFFDVPRIYLISYFQLISAWENYQQFLLKRLGVQARPQNVNLQ